MHDFAKRQIKRKKKKHISVTRTKWIHLFILYSGLHWLLLSFLQQNSGGGNNLNALILSYGMIQKMSERLKSHVRIHNCKVSLLGRINRVLLTFALIGVLVQDGLCWHDFPISAKMTTVTRYLWITRTTIWSFLSSNLEKMDNWEVSHG